MEVAAGSNPLDPTSVPANVRPEQPTILSIEPETLAPLTSFQVVLSSFRDPDDPGSSPAAVEWSLHSENLECELCSVEFRLAGEPTSLELPPGLLSAGTRVFASARYVDADGLHSDWS